MKRLLFFLLLSQSVALAFAQRSETLLSDGWHFLLGDAPGAEAKDYDDGRWQRRYFIVRRNRLNRQWLVGGEIAVGNDYVARHFVHIHFGLALE